MLKGLTVRLYERQQTGTDALNRPIYEETPVDIENVLIGPPSPDEIVEMMNLTGKRLVYTLGIPKGDTHEWEDCKVELVEPFPLPGMYHVIGPVTAGIESLVPGPWNKQVKVERYGKSEN